MPDQNHESDDKQALVSVVGATDLAGLSEPIKQLINVVCRGFGEATAAWLLKRDAKAKAASVVEISAAMDRVGLRAVAAGASLEERAKVRVEYQQAQQQANLEAVAVAAMEETVAYNNTSKSRPADVEMDWLNRFARHAQEVSNEDMRRVWGRVLAQETRSPGSFSYRALDTLSTMGLSDGLAFQHVCQFVYTASAGSGVLVPYARDSRLCRELDEKFRRLRVASDINLMITFGLFYADGLLGNLRVKESTPEVSIVISGRTLTAKSSADMLDFGPHYRMTPVGQELSALIEVDPRDDYVAMIKEALEDRGLVVRLTE